MGFPETGNLNQLKPSNSDGSSVPAASGSNCCPELGTPTPAGAPRGTHLGAMGEHLQRVKQLELIERPQGHHGTSKRELTRMHSFIAYVVKPWDICRLVTELQLKEVLTSSWIREKVLLSLS